MPHLSDPVSRIHVVAAAREWLGTPFRHQGRLMGRGCDCAGLVIGVAHALGVSEFDFTAYGHTPHSDMLRALCEAHMQPIQIEAAQPGDVLLMRWVDEPQHLGIVSDIGIIHAWAGARKVVEHGVDDTWRRRIVAAYAMPGVA